jgi:glycosyltransferase involved in cell wall biosynthesis
MKKYQTSCLKGISIVILTHNRIKYVEQLFSSLYKELKSFSSPAEVIIVDDSDSDRRTLISKMCEVYKYKFYFFSGSISAKRNFGIQRCSYDVILFIDSDCEVVSGLLYEHISGYTQDNIGGILGLTNFIGKENWFWRAIEKTTFHIAFSFAKRMDYALWGPCTNISFRKDVIEKVGGFKTKYPFDFSGEDVDIGLRINELGYKIKCNSNAIVNHSRETWSNFGKFCRKIFRWGRTDFHILKEHPYLSNIEFPKFTTISLLLFVSSMVSMLTGFGWRVAELLAIWLLFVPIIEAFLKSYKSKFADFLPNCLSFGLISIFELGAMLESLKNGSFSMLYKKIVYGKGQLIFEWDSKVVQNWSYVLALIIFLFALLLK